MSETVSASKPKRWKGPPPGSPLPPLEPPRQATEEEGRAAAVNLGIRYEDLREYLHPAYVLQLLGRSDMFRVYHALEHGDLPRVVLDIQGRKQQVVIVRRDDALVWIAGYPHTDRKGPGKRQYNRRRNWQKAQREPEGEGAP